MLRCITSVDLRDLTPMPSATDRNEVGSTLLIKNERPLLVTLSAKAIGSMGLGLSILAIWLRWIVPQKVEEPTKVPQLPPRKRSRRRHRLSVPPRRKAIAPRPRAVEDGSLLLSEENRRPRRVYFEDEERPNLPSPKEELKPILETSSESSMETSSVVPPEPEPIAPVVHLLLKRDNYEDSIAESESSSRRSSLCHLPKIKSPFTSKTRRRSASPDSLTRIQDAELGFLEKPKRSSTFTAPWSNSRKGKPTVTLTDETSSVRSFTPLSPFRRSSGSRTNSIDSVSSSSTPCNKPKPTRQPSTPIRRTQPYEAPYFATPPIAFQSRNDHDTTVSNSTTKEGRGRPSTPQNLPINRTRALAKQRSSSLDVTVRM